MAVVPSPFKVTPPDDLGTDRTLLDRLWRVVSQCAGVLRAFLGAGRVLEWHVDEVIDDLATPIAHGLKRKPFGYFIFRSEPVSTSPSTNYEAWTETTLAPKTATGTATISFVLFTLVLAILPSGGRP